MSSTTDVIQLRQFAKLKGDADHPAWKTAMRFTLLSAGLWDVVNGDTPVPVKQEADLQTISPTWIEWNTQNNKAMAQIILNVSPEIQVVI